MKSIWYPPDVNSVHIRFQWQQIVENNTCDALIYYMQLLKTIHAMHQFVPYAKSCLAIWTNTSYIS